MTWAQPVAAESLVTESAVDEPVVTEPAVVVAAEPQPEPVRLGRPRKAVQPVTNEPLQLVETDKKAV